jgi:hypothetical protein
MKELITEEQANQIVLLLSIAIPLAALGYGFFKNSKIAKSQKKLFWTYIILAALWGPAVWIFWQYLYNPIENYYGLDSLKALGINFCIAIGIGVIFFTLFYLAPRLIPEKPAPKRRK